MSKLELKQLAPYLPYNLQLYTNSNFRPNIKEKPLIKGASATLTGDLYADIEKNTFGWGVFKPVLRPLSDLTKEIEHNGGKFVPILVLSSISEGYYDDDGDFCPVEYLSIGYGVREGGSNCYFNEWKDGLRQRQSLSFKDGDFLRTWILNNPTKKWFVDAHSVLLNNQQLLFQKLYEWHFDTQGLIEKGLAIDINTLD